MTGQSKSSNWLPGFLHDRSLLGSNNKSCLAFQVHVKWEELNDAPTGIYIYLSLDGQALNS